MAIVSSNNLRILVAADTSGDGSFNGSKIPVAFSQSASLSFSNSLIDVTTKTSNAWAEKISGQRSFTLSTDGLLDFDNASAISLGGYALAGQEVFFDFGIGTKAYVGSGFISSFEQSGGTDDAPTYSISVEGNGPLVYDANTGA